MLQIALDQLAPEGRLLQVGYISEYPHNPEANVETSKNDVDASELFWKSQTIQRGKQTIYGNAWPKDYGTVAESKGRVLKLFAEKKLTSLIDDTEFSGLDSVSDAINHMLSGNSIGKVIVKVS
jgi:NADPH-dependent curcumin reductase CurA